MNEKPSAEPNDKSAITYLRVSTAEQATRGGREEGFSIPAQREANTRKAASLGAAVIAEFVDAGESGTKVDRRAGLQEMLAYIRDHPIDYCIVHKLDRLARSRADDVAIHFALKQAGVTSVSTSENIDETPIRHAHARDHVQHRRVLLPQPRQRSHQGTRPEGQPRRHDHPSTIGLQERPRHRRPRPREPNRRGRRRACTPHHVSLLPLRRRRHHHPAPPRRTHRPWPHDPRDPQVVEQSAQHHSRPQNPAQPLLQGRDPLPRRHLPRRPRTSGRPRHLAARPRPSGRSQPRRQPPAQQPALPARQPLLR